MDHKSRTKDRHSEETLEQRWWRWFKEGRSSPGKIRIGEFGLDVVKQYVRFEEPTEQQVMRRHRRLRTQPKKRSLHGAIGRQVWQWLVVSRGEQLNERGELEYFSPPACRHEHKTKRKAVACARRRCYAQIMRATIGPRGKRDT